MAVRIAIPEPTSSDTEYNRRALPQYVEALKAAGAEPVVVPLNAPQERVAKLLAGVAGVLLPGSKFDVDPERYGEAREPECADDDPARTAADELLLQDAFNLRKPILAICHGAQNLNVWRGGALIQDLKTAVNHRPGREVVKAHAVEIAKGSRLSGMLPAAKTGDIVAGNVEADGVGAGGVEETEVGKSGVEVGNVQVNSSHHQAIRTPGDNLRVTAVSPVDGVIEAVELNTAGPGSNIGTTNVGAANIGTADHFVVGVQWHPERTYAESEFSRAIFAAFLKAAAVWRPPQVESANGGN